MFENAKMAGQIRGLVPNLIEGGLTHLQYADDTIIFLNYDDQSIYNTKFLLYCFEDMSGLKINYEKSEVFALGCSDEEQKNVAEMFNCNIGVLPLKYQGILVSSKHMSAADLSYVHIKVEKKNPNLAECGFVLWWENDLDRILPQLHPNLYNGHLLFTRGDTSQDGHG
jgi:hypothetical protein